jgi:hypothetical protein
MIALFYLLVALCLIHALIQFAIGLAEIVLGVTQIVCGLVMMAFIFLRRLIFGKRKPSAPPAAWPPQPRTRRPAPARRGVPRLARAR